MPVQICSRKFKYADVNMEIEMEIAMAMEMTILKCRKSR